MIKNISKKITQNIEDISSKRINLNISGINNIFNNNQILQKKDFEINSLDYEEALNLDHRGFIQYYISLIKNNHPIFFSFFCFNDYNSQIIKIFLFFFSLSLDFSINALFFTDETMHKIYEDKGVFNILYNLPQILYSTLISKFIDSLIKNFALSQDNILTLKQENEKNNLTKVYKKLLKVLKIKFILFFIFAFIALAFFWYYITCFCGVYINTQSHLIKDSLISLITSLAIPFAMCLIPAIFRIPALRLEKPTGKLLYKFSALLENYLC